MPDPPADVLEQEGIGCITFSPLAHGLLTDRYLDGIPADSRAAKPHTGLTSAAITEDVLERVHLLEPIARERGQTLAQLALSWLLKDGRVTSVLVGASKPEQLDENIACLHNRKFAKEELDRIAGILRE